MPQRNAQSNCLATLITKTLRSTPITSLTISAAAKCPPQTYEFP